MVLSIGYVFVRVECSVMLCFSVWRSVFFEVLFLFLLMRIVSSFFYIWLWVLLCGVLGLGEVKVFVYLLVLS